MPRLVYTAAEAAEAIGVGENRIYELVAAGRIPAIKWGPRQIVIPKLALEEFLVAEAFRQQEERRQPSELSVPLVRTQIRRQRPKPRKTLE